ncbi:hypothetical protein HUW46_09209 [Amycolatopsis sp. CA-230715]|nr:hypothetical protein HUW46_09209 [Amycolatopsis sp. CA-230715]
MIAVVTHQTSMPAGRLALTSPGGRLVHLWPVSST